MPSQVLDGHGDSDEEDIQITVYQEQPEEVLEPGDTVQQEVWEVPEDIGTVVEESEPEAEDEERTVESEEDESEESSDNEEEIVCRSNRLRMPRRIMTYENVGGAPSWEVVDS